MIFSLVIFSLFLLGSVPVPYPPHKGPTLYVGLDGDDGYKRREAKNYNTPWRTIYYAISQLKPGDMLIVKDGIYTEAMDTMMFALITEGGTIDNWVIIKAENQFGAELSGQDNSVRWGLYLEDNANYIWIEGFEFYGFSRCGLMNNQSNHDVYFYKNYIHDIGRELREDPSGGTSGIKTNYYSRDITIDACIIHTIGRFPDPDEEGPWSSNYKSDYGIFSQGFGITIQNNLIYDCPAGWSIKIDGNNLGLAGSSHIITNNTFAVHSNPQRSGYLRFYSDTTENDYLSTDVIIQNNIFYEPGQGVAITKSQRDYTGIIRNNLMTCDTIIWDEYEEINPINIEMYDNIVNTYPDFVDTNSLDFHIQGTSPCIDSGFGGFAPNYDFEMNERPTGTGYDIGAYEYLVPSYIDEEDSPYKLEVSPVSCKGIVINYSIPAKEYINISVYDELGRKLAVLVDEIKNSGNYTEFKEINNLPSGTYFIVMRKLRTLASEKCIRLE